MNIPLNDYNRLIVAARICRMAQTEFYESKNMAEEDRRRLLRQARKQEKLLDAEIERAERMYPAACEERREQSLFEEEKENDG